MHGGLVAVPSCQLCGNDQRTLLFRDDPYEVVRCSECRLVYVSPRLTGESLRDQVYGEKYWKSDSPKTHGYADYAQDAKLYLKTFRKRARLLDPHFGGRKLKVLDIGCAAGFFLQVMREKGHDVYGVELSAPIATHAIEMLGAERVHIGTLESVAGRPGFARGTFDLVTLWDVVEHVPDPQTLLRGARSMLQDDGFLVLETQNVASCFARLLGSRWQHYKHQEHLYHFDPTTIRVLLAQSGFDVVRLTPRASGKFVSFGFLRERAARLHPGLSTLLSPLALCKRANLYVNLRDEMIVVARKRI